MKHKRNTQENDLARSSSVALFDCGFVEEMVHKIVKRTKKNSLMSECLRNY